MVRFLVLRQHEIGHRKSVYENKLNATSGTKYSCKKRLHELISMGNVVQKVEKHLNVFLNFNRESI